MKNTDRMTCKTCNTMTRLPEGYRIDWMQVVPRIVSTTDARSFLKHSCGMYLRGAMVQGKYSDKITCGEKCVSATRPICECSCKGDNHGGMAA